MEAWDKILGAGAVAESAVESGYQAIQSSWNELPPYWRKDTSPAMSPARVRAAVEAAELFAKAGATEKSITAFREAAQLSNVLGVSFSRGRTGNALLHRASLHARLFSKTGVDPLLGLDVGYELWRTGDGFAAVQEGAAWEQSAFPALQPGIISTSEREGRLLLLDSRGKPSKEFPVAILDVPGSLRSRLKAILVRDSAEEQTQSRFKRQAPEAFFASQASAASHWSHPFRLLLIVSSLSSC